MNRVRKPSAVYMALMMLVAVGGLVVFDILYNDYRQRQADQRFCELFIGLDDNYRAAPEGSLPARTQEFAGTVRRLRLNLRCPDTPIPTYPTQAPSPTSIPSPTG